MRKQQCRMASGGAVARVNGTAAGAEASAVESDAIDGSTSASRHAMNGATWGAAPPSSD